VRHIEAFGRFWLDFVVGDDWKIAAAVATVLGIGAVAAAASADPSWLAPVTGVAIALGFTIAVLIDVRRLCR
jgi:cytochrome b561